MTTETDPDNPTNTLLIELAKRSRSFLRSHLVSFNAFHTDLAQLSGNSSNVRPATLDQAFGNELFMAGLCSKFVILVAGAFWNRVTKELASNHSVVLGGVGEFLFITAPAEVRFFATKAFAHATFFDIEYWRRYWKVSNDEAILNDLRAVTDFANQIEPISYLNDWCVPLFCYRLLQYLLSRIVARNFDTNRAWPESELSEITDAVGDLEKSFAFAIYVSWVSSLSAAAINQASLPIEGIGLFYLTDDDIKFSADPAFVSLIQGNYPDEERHMTARTDG